MWRLHSLTASTGDFDRLVRRLTEPKARQVRSVLEAGELPELPKAKALSRVPSRQLSRQRSEGGMRPVSHDSSSAEQQRGSGGLRPLAIHCLSPPLAPAVVAPIACRRGSLRVTRRVAKREAEPGCADAGAGPGTAPPALTGQRLRQRSGLGMRRIESMGQAAAAGSGRGGASEGGMAVDIEEMEGLLDRVASKEWRERCEGLQALQELVVGCPYVPEDQLVAMFDGVVPRLADGNSKVTLVALAALTDMFPPLGESTAAALNNLVPALVTNLGALPSVSASVLPSPLRRRSSEALNVRLFPCFEQAPPMRRFALGPTARWMR